MPGESTLSAQLYCAFPFADTMQCACHSPEYSRLWRRGRASLYESGGVSVASTWHDRLTPPQLPWDAAEAIFARSSSLSG
jgi:hypothetical protein